MRWGAGSVPVSLSAFLGRGGRRNKRNQSHAEQWESKKETIKGGKKLWQTLNGIRRRNQFVSTTLSNHWQWTWRETFGPNCNHSLRPLTGEVVRGGGHSAPLEEGVRVRVHHQQTSHIPADFNGSHHFWMRLPFHWNAIHLRRKQTFFFLPSQEILEKLLSFPFFFLLLSCLVPT